MKKYKLPKSIKLSMDKWDEIVDNVKDQVLSLIDDIDAQVSDRIEDAADGEVCTDDVIDDITVVDVNVYEIIFDALGLDPGACWSRRREIWKERVKAMKYRP